MYQNKNILWVYSFNNDAYNSYIECMNILNTNIPLIWWQYDTQLTKTILSECLAKLDYKVGRVADEGTRKSEPCNARSFYWKKHQLANHNLFFNIS